MSERGEMIANTVYGSSMSELYGNLNASLESSLNGSSDILFFSAELDSKFGFSAGVNYSETANEIYFSASQVYAATLIEIDEYRNLDKFRSLWSDSALRDCRGRTDRRYESGKFPVQIRHPCRARRILWRKAGHELLSQERRNTVGRSGRPAVSEQCKRAAFQNFLDERRNRFLH